MNIKKIVITILSLLTLGVSFANANTLKTQKFTFKTLNNQKIILNANEKGIKLKNAKNKIVLLDFFGNMCPPCLDEIPDLITLQKKFKKNLQIIAFQVQTRTNNIDLRNFKKEEGINYPIVNLTDPNVYNFLKYIIARTNWKSMIPYAIIFDKQGRAQKIYTGERSLQEFENDIQILIHKKQSKKDI